VNVGVLVSTTTHQESSEKKRSVVGGAGERKKQIKVLTFAWGGVKTGLRGEDPNTNGSARNGKGHARFGGSPKKKTFLSSGVNEGVGYSGKSQALPRNEDREVKLLAKGDRNNTIKDRSSRNEETRKQDSQSENSVTKKKPTPFSRERH